MRPPLIELRQYVLAAGRRERMIELFDGCFATAQDALELPIIGQFRVRDDPDRFVWLRGFADMATRPERLGAFYGGTVWSEHGAEAIGYVTGYDNVQLLRAATPDAGLAVDLDARPPAGATLRGAPVLAVTYRLRAPADTALIAHCAAALRGVPHGLYVSETAANNFPALPIRHGEHLLTWIAVGEPAIDEAALSGLLQAPPERLHLEPTARSILR